MANSNPTWLDAFFAAGVVQIEVGGVPLPREQALNFAAGATGVDNPGAARSDLSVGGGAWSTALDLDFTAQPTQTLGTDGAKTVAGLTWTKENSASEAAAMVVTAGTGLQITPSNGPDYNFVLDYSGIRTCPLLRIPFSQLPGLATMSWQSKLRLWVAMTPQSLTFSGYTRVFAAIDSGPDVTTSGAIKVSAWAGGGGIDNDTVNSVGVNAMYTEGSTTVNTPSGFKLSGAFDVTTQVVMLELDRADGGLVPFSYFGSYAGAAFPSYYALKRVDGVIYGGSTLYVSAAPTDVRNMGLALGAVTNNPGPAATIQRVRLDVLL